MTIYEAKAVFQDYYLCKTVIEKDEHVLQSLEDGLKSMDYSQPAVVSSPRDEAPFVGIVELRSELVTQLRAEKEELEQIRMKTKAAVYWFEDLNLRIVMYLRYLLCLKWEDIERLLNYSHSAMMRMHRDALQLYADAH